MLRPKLWLGWFFGWDKGGVRATLFLIAFWVVLLGADCAYDRLTGRNSTSGTADCDAACHEWVERILRENPVPDVNRIVDDTLREAGR